MPNSAWTVRETTQIFVISASIYIASAGDSRLFYRSHLRRCGGGISLRASSCFRRRIYAAELCSRVVWCGVLYAEGSCSPPQPPLGGECVVAGRKKDWDWSAKERNEEEHRAPHTIIHHHHHQKYTHTGCYKKNPSVLVLVVGQKKNLSRLGTRNSRKQTTLGAVTRHLLLT